ncbi:MAG TPA: YdeI/OmpD-associated family protein [Flexivirga sp.]|uniref:YdeI/OmpD-associated family protein n=1 Tax=Flexivirga sp. TaxID=1962927 RepID=UPI002B60B02B|nr:YdeI/OmpD-associated family protein [Flexivirga sp.]HWC23790.1 YdeI/OmpD-associated family protein [Flexivirga sp.]
MAVECTAQTEVIGDRMIVRLPADASAALPSRGQIAATVTVNATPYPTVIEPDGRRGHWIAIDDGLRSQLHLDAGATVQLEIEPTKSWPEPEVPEDFSAALADAHDLTDVWEDITPMARWEWVRWINATKNPVTRDRRVEVGISKLRSGKRRPCCFDLSSCTDPEVAKSGKLVEPE